VITGGSSGIGLAVARVARERGARVSIVARDPERLDAATRELTADGNSEVAAASADVTDATAVQRAVDEVVERHGPCDVLVTCAGYSRPGRFEELDAATFRDQMDVDYFGTLHAVRAVTPAMIVRRRGHLVLVSSTAGLIGVYGYSAYAPAKFAVRGLAETLYGELSEYSIRVSCVYPPDTLTPGLERENETKPSVTARLSASITPRRPDQVATAIVRGIEHDRPVITVDVQTATLARIAGALAPYLRRKTARAVRRTSEGGGVP